MILKCMATTKKIGYIPKYVKLKFVLDELTFICEIDNNSFVFLEEDELVVSFSTKLCKG